MPRMPSRCGPKPRNRIDLFDLFGDVGDLAEHHRARVAGRRWWSPIPRASWRRRRLRPCWSSAHAGREVWTNADIFGDVLADSGLLAVLSGCESGQTQPNLVNEEVSLPAAFLAAGFRAVVATRWAVHDHVGHLAGGRIPPAPA